MEYRCPVPGCNHVGLIITKLHYKNIHNMDRKKAEEEYGKPKPIIIVTKKGGI